MILTARSRSDPDIPADVGIDGRVGQRQRIQSDLGFRERKRRQDLITQCLRWNSSLDGRACGFAIAFVRREEEGALADDGAAK